MGPMQLHCVARNRLSLIQTYSPWRHCFLGWVQHGVAVFGNSLLSVLWGWFICTWIQACSLITLFRDLKRTGGGPGNEELNGNKTKTHSPHLPGLFEVIEGRTELYMVRWGALLPYFFNYRKMIQDLKMGQTRCVQIFIVVSEFRRLRIVRSEGQPRP